LAGGTPILVLDMYEHSYHMDFGAKAGNYVDCFMDVIRWQNVEHHFKALSDSGST
jgi:superoxide dismutase, Fe-Mn family